MLIGHELRTVDQVHCHAQLAEVDGFRSEVELLLIRPDTEQVEQRDVHPGTLWINEPHRSGEAMYMLLIIMTAAAAALFAWGSDGSQMPPLRCLQFNVEQRLLHWLAVWFVRCTAVVTRLSLQVCTSKIQSPVP